MNTRQLFRHCALAIAALAFWPGSVPAQDTHPRSTSVDALHYRIELIISAEGDEIRGRTTIRFAALEDSVHSVDLDFGSLTVDEVADGNAATSFSHNAGRLHVNLAAAYRRGSLFSVAVAYHGHPTDGLFIKPNKFGD